MDIKLLYNLDSLGISNERINKNLLAFTNITQKNKYCANIIDTNNIFRIYFNQCIQLKIIPKYELEFVFANLDLYDKEEIYKLIQENLPKKKKASKKRIIRKNSNSKNTKQKFLPQSKSVYGIIYTGRMYY